ncbi:hypothetical protein [Acidovorax temperans]|uniref:hypothetical protein n=1 Tax=Acidovorax temperans TaxID=80878 RepID=UPI000A493B31|nr:hypothetical protein [Acidovorax temperans]
MKIFDPGCFGAWDFFFIWYGIYLFGYFPPVVSRKCALWIWGGRQAQNAATAVAI